jgi:hypothetical protein
MQTWIDPTGEDHDVHQDRLRAFCNARRELNASNMVDHVTNVNSDQKCGGWRLIERLWWIYHVDQPDCLVPALGTLDAFFLDCKNARDGRAVLTSRESLRKMLGGTYNGGKPYQGWQRKKLDKADAVRRLRDRRLRGDQHGQDLADVQSGQFQRDSHVVRGHTTV